MIYKEITDDYYFWDWVKNSDSYNNNFSMQGAKALQAYMDELSEDLGENISFDPVAWCVEYTEYEDFDEFKHDNSWTDASGEHEGYDNIKTLDDLQDNTTVIEFDGGIIVQEF